MRGLPAFLTTDRLWGFALRPLRIPHQGDRIRTYGSLNLLAFLIKDRLCGFARYLGLISLVNFNKNLTNAPLPETGPSYRLNEILERDIDVEYFVFVV